MDQAGTELRYEGPIMRVTLTVEEAQAQLKEWIGNLTPGEEIIITDNQQPVAKLVGMSVPQRKPRQPGTLRGTVLYMAPDFDAPLEEFREYME
jgi:antitoxin (DNA-binding transcriptional repressor) of toxin-antitoxin stability system